jgi:hypothetical protein
MCQAKRLVYRFALRRANLRCQPSPGPFWLPCPRPCDWPGIGQLSGVLYSVDRAGNCRFIAFDPASPNVFVHDETRKLEPTGRFELYGLLADRDYKFTQLCARR